MTRKTSVLIALAAIVVSFSAKAGIHDPANFDVGDYIQSGLQLHYDGIRNAGVDAARDTTAKKWRNLGSAGSDWDLKPSGTDSQLLATWEDDGSIYMRNQGTLDNNHWLPETTNFPVASNYTVQIAMDVSAADVNRTTDNQGWILYSGSGMLTNLTIGVCSGKIALKDSAENGRGTVTNYFFYRHPLELASDTAHRVAFTNETTTYRYATAILGNDEAMIFEGTSRPLRGTTGSSGYYTVADSAQAGREIKYLRVGFGLVGKIYNIRYYGNKVLTDDELAWNRAVDEARFFGAAAPTNIVVASRPAGLPGYEANGVYAIDSDGYTFSAPNRCMKDGVRYVLSGYTTEEWIEDGTTSRWSAVTMHAGSSRCTVAYGEPLRRITWQWTPERAWSKPSDFGPIDYAAQEHLFLHYDGAANGGLNGDLSANHVSSTDEWANIGYAGADFDLGPFKSNKTQPGNWDKTSRLFTRASGTSTEMSVTDSDSEYCFEVKSRKFMEGTNFTVQAAVDARLSDIYRTHDCKEWVLYPRTYNGVKHTDMFVFGIDHTTNGTSVVQDGFYMNQKIPLDEHLYFTNNTDVAERRYRYATGIRNGDTAKMFDDLPVPAEDVSGNNVATRSSGYVNEEYNLPGLLVGFGFCGKIYNIRYYHDRVLSEEELAWNRKVDDARFYDIMPQLETNAVVCTWPEYLYGDPDGYLAPTGVVYQVNRAGYTFTAPDILTNMVIGSSGEATVTNYYNRVGYVLERWDEGAGDWSESATTNLNASYCHVSTNDRVRITWLWRSNKVYAKDDARLYVQDGLYLHYDGIRNKGLSAAHDGSSSTWANLGSGGADFDLSRQTGKNPRIGYWDDDGYVFAGYTAKEGFTVWGHDLEVVPDYTLQVVLDAKPNVQTNASGELKLGYVCCPIGYIKGQSSVSDYAGWRYFAMQVRGDTTRLSTPVFKNTSQPAVLGTSGVAFSYATAMMSGATNAVVFAGVEPPWDAPVGGANGPCLAPNGYEFANRAFVVTNFTLGVGNGLNEGLNEKVRGVRYYKRLLTNAELKWNRIVDDMRFSDETNVFVYVEAEPGSAGAATLRGVYMVEPAGGTLSAPSDSFTDAFGNTYHLRGYMLEVWDDAANGGEGGWVASYGAGSSIVVDPGAKIRVTWQWRADGWRYASDYDVGDYVQDGLTLHYDGIRNVGAGAAHDDGALTWKNLGSGVGYDLERWSHNALTTNSEGVAEGAWLAGNAFQGAWTADGFSFNHYSLFHTSTSLGITNYTMQILGDADVDGQQVSTINTNETKRGSGFGYMFFASNDSERGIAYWKRLSFGVTKYEDGTNRWRGAASVMDYYFTGYDSGWYVRPTVRGDRLKYITAVLDDDYGVAFADATPPEGWTTNKAECITGRKQSAKTTSINCGFSVGGQSSPDLLYNGENFTGTINSIRYYGRVLDRQELAWNRMVDDARFFGVVPTNTIVSSSLDFLPAGETGSYAVGGAGHVFSAPATATYGDATYECDGYAIETMNGEGKWGAPEIVRGANFVEVAGTNFVRITWLWKETSSSNASSAKALGVGDYVTDGLLLHYDGICNLGADRPHGATARRWVNIAPGGGYDLTLASYDRGSACDMWREDGYHFGTVNNTFFYHSQYEPLFLPSNYTMQVALDAITIENSANLAVSYSVDSTTGFETTNRIDNTVSTNPGYMGDGKIGYLFFMPKYPKYSSAEAANYYFNKGSLALRCDYAPHRLYAITDRLMYYDSESVAQGTAMKRPWVTAWNDCYTTNTSARGAAFRYATLMVEGPANACRAMVFQETAKPTVDCTTLTTGSSPTGTYYEMQSKFSGMEVHRFALGGKGEFADEKSGHFRGTIKNFRLYGRALTAAELEQNRRVDESRLYGVTAQTNAVIASLPGGLGGVEACGAYSVSGDGHTFAAPTLAVDANGRMFRYSGRYTLESWDDDKNSWGAATVMTGGSQLVGSSDSVRIMWIYEDEPVKGLAGMGWGTGDYAQDDLVVHYDGIRNMGANEPHDTNSIFWCNAAGSNFEMRRMRYFSLEEGRFVYARAGGETNVRAEDAPWGEWTEKGFLFDGREYFTARQTTYDELWNPPHGTIQIRGDFAGREQTSAYTESCYGHVYTPVVRSGMSIAVYGTHNVEKQGNMLFRTAYRVVGGIGGPCEGDMRYITAMYSPSNAVAFADTAVPAESSASWYKGSATNRTMAAGDDGPDWGAFWALAVGATHAGIYEGGAAAGCVVGEVNSVRHYTRHLNGEELRWNRMLDDERFGDPTVTNVVVAGELPSGMGELPGAYRVCGAWTFTSRKAFRADGQLMEPDGYTLEYGDAASGAWGAPVSFEGDSYTYTEGQTPKLLRLTWKWKPWYPNTVIINYK